MEPDRLRSSWIRPCWPFVTLRKASQAQVLRPEGGACRDKGWDAPTRRRSGHSSPNKERPHRRLSTIGKAADMRTRTTDSVTTEDILNALGRYTRESPDGNKAGHQSFDTEGVVARCCSTSTVPPGAVSGFFKTRRIFVMRVKIPPVTAHDLQPLSRSRDAREEASGECQAPIL
jgi:hypothetical protein